jgi:excisionase family DNA binding protein
MKKPSPLFEYPVTIKQVGQYWVFSTPDLVTTVGIPFSLDGKEILEGLKAAWKKNQGRLKDFESSTIKTPEPSRIRKQTEKKSEKPLTATQVAKLLSKSRWTIIRAAEKGLIKGVKTEGGHWRFNLAQVSQYQELASQVAVFKKKETEWLTPLQCAQIWGVSVNTARNWIDAGKVWSEKTKGGRRRVPKGLMSQKILTTN